MDSNYYKTEENTNNAVPDIEALCLCAGDARVQCNTLGSSSYDDTTKNEAKVFSSSLTPLACQLFFSTSSSVRSFSFS